MHAKLNLPLIIAVLSWVFFSSVDVLAQSGTVPAAAPLTVVESQTVARGDELVVLELFSSQACVFCPKADQLFAELVQADNVIGLACHVDYFDVRTGSLSRPFCTSRQNWYMQALGAGPNYTPQMIVNGGADVVGYKTDDIKAAIKAAQQRPPLDIIITKTDAADDFTLSWDARSTTTENEPAILWLMMIDKPHDIEIADGRNKGRKAYYVNIVSDMEERGSWEEAGHNKVIRAAIEEQQSGFVVLAQGTKSGKILAAGQYRKP